MGGRKKERERHPESSKMAKKEMKMKRARWLARYKKATKERA